MPIINRIAEFHEDMKEWRQYLHAHPELGYDVEETAAYVVDKLKSFGITQIEEGVGRTGVVAVIEGQGGDGPTIGLRADMDALPIQEVRDLPYKSKVDGKMHACGHDGHTTMLLGAARYLAETRNFSGRVALIFQPAEEGGGGGLAMCEDGMMEKYAISQVYGIHNHPGGEFGAWYTRPGPLMAAADTFEIKVTGKGAHAAMPHEGIDSVMIACQIAQGLQMIAARNVDPLKSCVLSITQIHAGATHNVIPDTAQLSGTVRTLDEEVRDFTIARMSEVAENIARAHGGTAVVEYEKGYPVTVNHPAETEFASAVAAAVSGEERVDTDVSPMMGAEDFSYMLEKRPGAYMFLGGGGGAGLHHPEYDFNDEMSPVGASWFVKVVETAQPAT
ncbi:M20 aminoacylase family protein [Pontivivens insulae]|uniref:Putative hydrolase YxeP n=1 Tax=Pontivivens insulae TaxID=1639689 RepID=A0A2R8AB20_9RHOB|nr:M20 aminoacylase family protein [Pontivivens insulae]RED13334.1 hippurate hydrolase [Pontivivens insulae]SPF29426.1 putative hydrolase YxeP [Pontivivens insulae]